MSQDDVFLYGLKDNDQVLCITNKYDNTFIKGRVYKVIEFIQGFTCKLETEYGSSIVFSMFISEFIKLEKTPFIEALYG